MSLSSPTRREALAVLLAAPVASLAASPTQWTLQQASEQIRAKKISPVELTRTCLDRIQLLNPRLNAFITVMADQALAQARALEAELHTGKWRGPLHGIPIGLKDLFDTASVKTTCASAVFADRIPAEDAEVVVQAKTRWSRHHRQTEHARVRVRQPPPFLAILVPCIILGIPGESPVARREGPRPLLQPVCVLGLWAPIPVGLFANRRRTVGSPG